MTNLLNCNLDHANHLERIEMKFENIGRLIALRKELDGIEIFFESAKQTMTNVVTLYWKKRIENIKAEIEAL